MSITPRNFYGQDNKISSRNEISLVWKKGLRWRCSAFVIVYLQSKFRRDRSAVLVSKANGNAVQRNRAKRVLREILRNNKSVVPPFFDILIKPEGKNLPPAEELKHSYLAWKSAVSK